MNQNLNLGVIGNCSVAALISKEASIEWFCYSQYDGDPIFSGLLDGSSEAERKGYFKIALKDLKQSHQQYDNGTAILRTTQENGNGEKVEIIDFCPVPKSVVAPKDLPKTIIRLVYPIGEKAKISCDIKPTADYGSVALEPQKNEDGLITYRVNNNKIFLKSDFYSEDFSSEYEREITKPVFFIFGEKSDITSFEEAENALSETKTYWENWVDSLSLPKSYQEETIRAAITLKMCTHKPTGGIVAALTSSIPEYDDCKFRHWDYRYSWVRDNYFTINALLSLGDKEALVIYAEWLKQIMSFCRENEMYPAAFRISGSHDAEESICETLSGYRGQGMVRVGNEAYKQEQNDFFAGVILTLKPFFVNPLMKNEECPVPVEWLENLAEIAKEKYNVQDAGLWEFRTCEDVYTYSAVNCWSACSSMHEIYESLGNLEKASYWKNIAKEMYDDISKNAWNEELESYTNSFKSTNADASVFLLSDLGFLDSDNPRLEKTISFTESRLRQNEFVMRHDHVDDFGTCVNAFVSCTFWMLMAMIDSGSRIEEAEQIFKDFLKRRNSVGMLSEHIDQNTGELWANYPQTYSMAGIVSVANRLSSKND